MFKRMECNTRSMGQGKQTILIIKYGTTLNEFLLYSTVRYAIKEDVLDFFREKSLLKTNLLQTRDDGYEVKYYETVEEVIDRPSTRIGAFNKFHILTRNHVKKYLGRNNSKIWILRFYALDAPQILKKN